MTAIERVKEALHLLELVDEELSEHEGEYDFAWSIIQDAVYCQKIINSIVWRCNKVNNPGLEKPKEPSGDLISRSDVIDAFTEDGTWLERQGVTSLTMVEAKQRAVDILSTLPSAKGGDAEMNEVKPQYMQVSPSNGADLISRADAIEAVGRAKATDPFGRYDKQNIGIDWALDALKALPSAEAVEVVRCKECRHSRIEGDTTMFMWCGYWNKPTDGIRYCSDGERRRP